MTYPSHRATLQTSATPPAGIDSAQTAIPATNPNSLSASIGISSARNDTLSPVAASIKIAMENKSDDLNAARGVIWGVALSSVMWMPAALWWLS